MWWRDRLEQLRKEQNPPWEPVPLPLPAPPEPPPWEQGGQPLQDESPDSEDSLIIINL